MGIDRPSIFGVGDGPKSDPFEISKGGRHLLHWHNIGTRGVGGTARIFMSFPLVFTEVISVTRLVGMKLVEAGSEYLHEADSY